MSPKKGLTILTDKQWLEEKYKTQGLSCEKISLLVGCNGENIRYWLKKHGIERRKSNDSLRFKGVKRSKDICQKISYSKLGHSVSEETRKKISLKLKGKPLPLIHRRNIAKGQSGEKSHLWRGGITPKIKLVRHCLEMKLWRESVFKRDDFTCQVCGIHGGPLEADHIKPFCKFPDLRFDISNGRTLCKECHKQTSTYGIKALSYTS